MVSFRLLKNKQLYCGQEEKEREEEITIPKENPMAM